MFLLLSLPRKIELAVDAAYLQRATMKLAVNYSAGTVIDLMGQVYAFGETTGIR